MDKPSPSRLTRRSFVHSAAAVSALAGSRRLQERAEASLPAAFSSLQPLGSRVKPISSEEFGARIERARELLARQDPPLDALFLATGSSLYYFTGVKWWPSERLLAVLVPRKGDPLVVCPAFEEGRFREQIRFPADVRVWQEDQSPTKLAAALLADHGLRAGRIG